MEPLKLNYRRTSSLRTRVTKFKRIKTSKNYNWCANCKIQDVTNRDRVNIAVNAGSLAPMPENKVSNCGTMPIKSPRLTAIAKTRINTG